MRDCIRSSWLTTRTDLHPMPPHLQGNSAAETPRSSTQPSPTINLTCDAYALAVEASSYGEIWSKIHPDNTSYLDPNPVEGDSIDERQSLPEVLQPNQECVEEVLHHIRPNALSCLISGYFDHSENTSNLCLLLHDSVRQARIRYAPLHNLLDVLPMDSDSHSLSESQCDRAFDIFLQFDCFDNPFSGSDSYNFHDMRCHFSQLRQELDYCLRKSRSKVRHLRRATYGTAICLVGTVVSVAVSAAAIATHTFIAFVACPFLPAFLPFKVTKKELAHVALLEAADRGTYVLQNELDTIDRLVARLHTTIEGDKLLIRLGLERGRDRHPIQEVVKQLHKNHQNFLRQLIDLEEHICLYFVAVNRARSRLLEEIHLHQTHYS